MNRSWWPKRAKLFNSEPATRSDSSFVAEDVEPTCLILGINGPILAAAIPSPLHRQGWIPPGCLRAIPNDASLLPSGCERFQLQSLDVRGKVGFWDSGLHDVPEIGEEPGRNQIILDICRRPRQGQTRRHRVGPIPRTGDDRRSNDAEQWPVSSFHFARPLRDQDKI